MPAAIDQGLGILVWSPLAGGLLSGKFRRGHELPKTSRHLTAWNEPPVHTRTSSTTLLRWPSESARCMVSAAQVSLAWLLRKPGVTFLVIGAREGDGQQLADNLAAAQLSLPTTSWPSSTRSALTRCRTRIGTSRTSRRTGSRPPTVPCWVNCRANSLLTTPILC